MEFNVSVQINLITYDGDSSLLLHVIYGRQFL